MQKISTYLYPNRIQLLADLAGFNVEYTNVYQRNVKIYKGVDNVLEFDVKNADQKRINLTTLNNIRIHLMDSQGNAINDYEVLLAGDQTNPNFKGLMSTNIPAADLVDLSPQFLSYSVTYTSGAGPSLTTNLLYGDTRFGASGKMELLNTAVANTRAPQVITSFYSDMEYNTLATERFHSSAIPVRFYEAIPTTSLDLDFTFDNFEGTVTIELTKDASISSESFSTRGTKLEPFAVIPATTSSTITVNAGTFAMEELNTYCFLRVTYTRKFRTTGKITKVIVS